jgi:hypothetical protein
MTASLVNPNSTPSDSIPGELFCFQVMFPEDHTFVDLLQEHPLLAYASTFDLDTLHYHKVMKAPDKAEFIKGCRRRFLARSSKESTLLFSSPRSQKELQCFLQSGQCAASARSRLRRSTDGKVT